MPSNYQDWADWAGDNRAACTHPNPHNHPECPDCEEPVAGWEPNDAQIRPLAA